MDGLITVSATKITLSKIVFVEDFNSWGGLPTNTTKIEPSRILMIPQYRVLICLFTGGQILFVIKKIYMLILRNSYT